MARKSDPVNSNLAGGSSPQATAPARPGDLAPDYSQTPPYVRVTTPGAVSSPRVPAFDMGAET
jgi:hypothetical protein